MSALYDFYPQHCLLPDFSQEEHAVKVHDKLVTSFERLPTAAKQTLLQTIANALKTMAATLPTSPQRVGATPTSEGYGPIERVHNALPITMTTSPTEPHILKEAPQTHGRTTRNNTPDTVPPFVGILGDPYHKMVLLPWIPASCE